MTTFTSGKIRKNASKKIETLLQMATRIVSRTQSRGMDDCYRSNEPRTVDASRVREWMADSWNYRSMSVYLECDAEGNPTCLTLGGASYWQDDFIITFNRDAKIDVEEQEVKIEAVKPRMTLEAVKAYRAKGFISPLSHGAVEEQPEADQDKVITKIKVLWSESGFFNRALREEGDGYNLEKEVSREQYNALCAQQVASMMAEGYEGGYYKTNIEVTTASGQTATFRHDISPNWYERTLQTAWSLYVDYCRKQHAENKATLERIAKEEEQELEEAVELAMAEASNVVYLN